MNWMKRLPNPKPNSVKRVSLFLICLFIVAIPAGCRGRINSPYRCGNSAPQWTVAPPEGCLSGYAGPTLNPADQVVYAQADAREKLAFARLGVKVESFWVDLPDGVSELTTQEAKGFLRNTRIVTMWNDPKGKGPVGKQNTMYALACAGEAAARLKNHRQVPQWVFNVPQEPGRMCALGLSGPTVLKMNQLPNAEADALDRLAETIAIHAHVFSLDIDSDDFRFAGESGSEAWAQKLAKAKGRIEQAWRDEKGRGPLGYKNVIYALACVGS